MDSQEGLFDSDVNDSPALPLEGGGRLQHLWRGLPTCPDWVDKISGDNGVECAAYKPTRHELLILAGHWVRKRLGIQLSGRDSKDWIQIEDYANTRLSRMAEAIGAAALKQVVNDVEKDLREGKGEEEWRILTEGTKDERDGLRDALEKEAERDAIGGGCPTCGGWTDGLQFAETDVHWCEKDRVYWCVEASNVFVNIAGLTLQEQQDEWDRIGLSKFARVAPSRRGLAEQSLTRVAG